MDLVDESLSEVDDSSLNGGGHALTRRAADVGEASGVLSDAAGAAMTLIEEHGARRALTEWELYDLYRRADGLLKDSQNVEEVARLRACARIVMRRLAGVQLGDKNFTLFDAVHEVETRLITQALDEAGGSVTRAARLLGVRHQTLAAMLQTRHKRLMDKRTPPEKRRRSIIKKPKQRVAQNLKSPPETQLSDKG
jgi:DNA-binding protein Fis